MFYDEKACLFYTWTAWRYGFTFLLLTTMKYPWDFGLVFRHCLSRRVSTALKDGKQHVFDFLKKDIGDPVNWIIVLPFVGSMFPIRFLFLDRRYIFVSRSLENHIRATVLWISYNLFLLYI